MGSSPCSSRPAPASHTTWAVMSRSASPPSPSCCATSWCSTNLCTYWSSDLDHQVCDGKTLHGSIEPTPGGGSAFIAQVTLYSVALGVAISQACYATGKNREGAVLRQLLGEELDLKDVLIQAEPAHNA